VAGSSSFFIRLAGSLRGWGFWEASVLVSSEEGEGEEVQEGQKGPGDFLLALGDAVGVFESPDMIVGVLILEREVEAREKDVKVESCSLVFVDAGSVCARFIGGRRVVVSMMPSPSGFLAADAEEEVRESEGREGKAEKVVVRRRKGAGCIDARKALWIMSCGVGSVSAWGVEYRVVERAVGGGMVVAESKSRNRRPSPKRPKGRGADGGYFILFP
jgi:hypothetical protein